MYRWDPQDYFFSFCFFSLLPPRLSLSLLLVKFYYYYYYYFFFFFFLFLLLLFIIIMSHTKITQLMLYMYNIFYTKIFRKKSMGSKNKIGSSRGWSQSMHTNFGGCGLSDFGDKISFQIWPNYLGALDALPSPFWVSCFPRLSLLQKWLILFSGELVLVYGIVVSLVLLATFTRQTHPERRRLDRYRCFSLLLLSSFF